MRLAEASALRYDISELGASHKAILDLAGTGKRVLELGCATGYMSQALHEAGNEVVAVDCDRPAINLALTRVSGVKFAFCDLDRLAEYSRLPFRDFDVITAADVLEHLRDPLTCLQYIREEGWLKPYTGRLIASIPNVAHGSVRLALLCGCWPYSELGLLDRTHLRFFTRQSVLQLFADAGYEVVSTQYMMLGIEDSEVPWPRAAIPESILAHMRQDETASIYQFIVEARISG